MGDWRPDQSKKTRRYVWGQTRGEQDETLRDFNVRVKAYPQLAALRAEKIGSEIHLWRMLKEDSGKDYWISCLRFVDDTWGYWSVFYRTDERRWRTTPVKDEPLGRALATVADFFREEFAEPA
jgi:hypothetical protein